MGEKFTSSFKAASWESRGQILKTEEDTGVVLQRSISRTRQYITGLGQLVAWKLGSLLQLANLHQKKVILILKASIRVARKGL